MKIMYCIVLMQSTTEKLTLVSNNYEVFFNNLYIILLYVLAVPLLV